jgi:hypothetical protein
VDVFVTIGPLIPQLVGTALDVSGPPSTNIIDGGKGFFWSLVYRKGSGVILALQDRYLRHYTTDWAIFLRILSEAPKSAGSNTKYARRRMVHIPCRNPQQKNRSSPQKSQRNRKRRSIG